MKKIIPTLAIAVVLCIASSCNEKPKHYTFVQNMADGKQITEQIDAKNDTDALKLYIDRMSQVIVNALADSTSTEAPIESMYIISPSGDTLNTNTELMKAIENDIAKSPEAVTIPLENVK